MPPLVSTPDPPCRPSVAASQRTRRSSTSVAAGDCSKESSDWFVAPIASSAAAADEQRRRLQVRGAARVAELDAVREHGVAELREHRVEREPLVRTRLDRLDRGGELGGIGAGARPPRRDGARERVDDRRRVGAQLAHATRDRR